jgi:hypothetical protein
LHLSNGATVNNLRGCWLCALAPSGAFDCGWRIQIKKLKNNLG